MIKLNNPNDSIMFILIMLICALIVCCLIIFQWYDCLQCDGKFVRGVIWFKCI